MREISIGIMREISMREMGDWHAWVILKAFGADQACPPSTPSQSSRLQGLGFRV